MLFSVIGDGRILESYAKPVFYGYRISDDLLHSHDLEVTDETTSYGKETYILINKIYPLTITIRIKFDLKSSSGGVTAYGRIYKNGSPVGTEQTTSETSYQTYSEDISFNKGDTIELWIKSGTAFTPVYAKNLRIYGEILEQDFEEFAGTNYGS